MVKTPDRTTIYQDYLPSKLNKFISPGENSLDAVLEGVTSVALNENLAGPNYLVLCRRRVTLERLNSLLFYLEDIICVMTDRARAIIALQPFLLHEIS